MELEIKVEQGGHVTFEFGCSHYRGNFYIYNLSDKRDCFPFSKVRRTHRESNILQITWVIQK